MLLHTQNYTRNTVETFLEAVEVEGHNHLICSGENTQKYIGIVAVLKMSVDSKISDLSYGSYINF